MTMTRRVSEMSAESYEELLTHVGHEVKCVTYGTSELVYNVAIECYTCNEVLLDFDHPELAQQEHGVEAGGA